MEAIIISKTTKSLDEIIEEVTAHRTPVDLCRCQVEQLGNDPKRTWECLCYIALILQYIPPKGAEAVELGSIARVLIREFSEVKSPDLARILALIESSQTGQSSDLGISGTIQRDLYAVSSNGTEDPLAEAKRLDHLGRHVQAAALYAQDPQSQLAALRSYRIAGVFGACNDLISRLGDGEISAEEREDLRWEQVCVLVQQDGCIDLLADLIKRGSPLRTFDHVIRVAFWCMALDHPQSLGSVPNYRGLRSLASKESEETPERMMALKVILGLEKVWGGEGTIADRLNALENAMTEFRNTVFDGELLMLGWASVARWALVHSFKSTYDLAIGEYEKAAYLASNGGSKDPIGVLGNQKPWESVDHSYFTPKSRLLGFTSFAFGVAKDSAKFRLSRLNKDSNAQAEIKKSEVEAHAKRLSNHITRFKGLLLRLGQTSIGLHEKLPEPMAEAVSQLSEKVVRLEEEDVRKILTREWKADPSEVLKEFDYWPMSAASIGQVHRAKTHQGDAVAVKVQYPDIEKGIAAEVATMKTLIPLFKMLAPGTNPRDMITSVHNLFNNGCDYVREAEYQQRFEKAVTHLEGIYIPKVVKELSTKKVLVSECIEGLHLKDFVRMASTEERDLAGERVFRGLMTPRAIHRFFNADVHAGNFRFTNSVVYFLDFGACNETVDDEFRICEAIMNEDYVTVGEIYHEQGFFRKGRELNPAQVKEYVEASNVHFFRDKVFKFDRQYLQKYLEVSGKFKDHFTLPGAKLPIIRAEIGLIGVLVDLEASANWGRLMVDILEASGNDYPILKQIS
jgi:predicted unusual protein kinase regulating ubiquinone biosynthesis (AarF/ABC1/UbiB family)